MLILNAGFCPTKCCIPLSAALQFLQRPFCGAAHSRCCAEPPPLLFVWCRYGNVSSSSIWYVLAYIETFRGVTTGDRVWQLGFGSGFKCNSAVWKANRCAAVQRGLVYALQAPSDKLCNVWLQLL